MCTRSVSFFSSSIKPFSSSFDKVSNTSVLKFNQCNRKLKKKTYEFLHQSDDLLVFFFCISLVNSFGLKQVVWLYINIKELTRTEKWHTLFLLDVQGVSKKFVDFAYNVWQRLSNFGIFWISRKKHIIKWRTRLECNNLILLNL